LWDELHQRLKAKGVSIRGIWIADVAHQGTSGVINEKKLGNDRTCTSKNITFMNLSLITLLASWSDHPRDLFLMVNHFRRQITQPIIGVGHSMGGCHLVNLALMHPRLFTTLILMDPVIQRLPSRQGNFGPAKASTSRRDRWPSRKAAEASFKRSKFYQTWDPRVLDLWIKHGLRDLPTLLHPDATPASGTLPPLNADPSSATVSPDKSETEVTLTTTKHQEVLTFMRPNFPGPTNSNPEERPNPVTHPDVNPEAGPNTPFYRPEPISTFRQLPYLRPSVLYIFGDQSFLSAPLLKADKMAHTGVAPGGSGGFKKGRVQEVTFEGIGHLIPMEVVGKTADACQDWIALELANWKSRTAEHELQWSKVPREERGRMSEEFVAVMKSDWMDEPAKSKL
jgi:pimeloyl-ACP methyl ester carboxylesterase